MISKEMEKALNTQIKHELYSAYLYAAMGAHFDAQSLRGFANWMKVQAQEEMGHAIRFYTYLVDASARPILEAIEKPPAEFGKPAAVFEDILKHERFITGCIHKLVDQAVGESDHATRAFLEWFVNEQVEEESNADQALQNLKFIGDNPVGVLMMDRELATRMPGPGAPGAPGGAATGAA